MSKNKSKPDQYTLADIFREIELELISSMQRTLSRHEAWEEELGFQWEQWQSAKLRSLSQFQKRNRKVIKSYQDDIKNTIDEVLHSSYDDAYRKSLELTKSWDLDTALDSSSSLGTDELLEDNFFHTNDEKLEVIIEEMQKTFVNSEGIIMRKMDDTYRQVLDKSVLKLGAGATTIQKAIDDSTQEFLSKGIDCITYKNGRKVNIASYAEMYLRTANQQATFLAQGKVRDKLGIYTVLMSQHENCSPMCLPYQGTVMIDDVYTSITEDYAIQLSRETGYERLSTAMKNHAFHPNCRHSITTWYPGKSSVPAPFTLEQNARAVERSKLEQEQRVLESYVRKWKRIEAGSTDSENMKFAQEKVKMYQKHLRDHVKSNQGLRRKYWRERIEPMLDANQEQLVSRSIPKRSYDDVTQQWLDNVDHTATGQVIKNDFFDVNGVRYDSSNARLDMNFGGDEINTASWLKDTFHDDVRLVPRPQNVNGRTLSSSDYIFRDEPWDLKTINGSGKDVIRDRIKISKQQASNFIIDITDKTKLSNDDILNQAKKLFTHSNTKHVDSVIVKKNKELLMILKRKR